MKRNVPARLALLPLMLMIIINTANAQSFLKRELDNVKNTLQNRGDSKVTSATNKTLDKTDSLMSGNHSSKKSDTSATNRVLGGFAKAANDNPNDTSMSDLVAKALGNIAGGNGVSAADSAKAIEGFKKTGEPAASGFYYETTNTVIAKGKAPVSNITKNWFTTDGRARGEMDLAWLMAAMMGQKINSKPVVMISRASMPTYSVTLDDETKTYALNIIDTALINSNQDQYKAVVVGNESVGGYSCKHVKLTSKRETIDMWTSTGVPGYSVYEKMANAPGQSSTGSMLSALKQAGAMGCLVKMCISNKDVSETMELTKAISMPSIASSFFTIPKDYSQSGTNGVISNLMSAGSGGK
ncbi:MAG TPA: DUF4412 domain-containing protein [Puia sp.]|nr:DUF4412 domain-containing protein [Puia sp.]